MGIRYASVVTAVTQYIIVHLFLTLASLPIIVAWGLPLSRLAPIGNFLFSPIIFLFLLLSSAIFFCEILHVPYGFIIWLLEKTTSGWQWILKFHGTDTLYGFCKPPYWLLIAITIATFLSVVHPRMRTQRRRLIGLLLLLCLSMIAIEKISQPQTIQTEIPCHGGAVTLIHRNGNTVLIDPGYMGRRISAPSWVSYTLVPKLITQIGNLTIDHLIILKPGIMVFDAVKTLCDTITVRNLYIPYMYGTLSPRLRCAWGKLYWELQKQNSNIVRIYKEQPLTVHIDDEITIHITPEKEATYREIKYQQAQITAQPVDFLQKVMDSK